MNAFLVFSCLFAVAAATPGFLSYGTVGPVVETQQYHAQDAFGQYTYGYSGGPSAKEETRTADGITRGSYSYVDANGIVQSTSYVSDPVNGFRVAATNLPTGPAAPAAAVVSAPAVVAARTVAPVYTAPAVVAAPTVVAAPAVVGTTTVYGTPAETPEVVAAKAAHFAAHNEALARLGRKKRGIFSAPVAYSAPAATVVSAGPAVVAAKSAAVVATAPASTSYSYSTVAAAPAVVAARTVTPVVAAAPAIVETQNSVAYSTPGSTVVSSSAPISGSFSYSTSSLNAAPVAVAARVATPVVAAAPAIAARVATPVVAAAPAVVAAAPTIVETPSSVAYSTGDSNVVSSAAPVSGSFSYSSSSLAASPIPTETIAAAPAVVAAAPAVVAARAVAPVVAAPAVATAPVVAARYATTAAVVAPAVSTSSQFQAQDAFGQYNYGYADQLSAKHETRSADGTTFGKYSYVDSNGIVQSVKYVADAAGFRVHATNLPVA